MEAMSRIKSYADPGKRKRMGIFAEVRAMLAKMVFAERFGLTPYIEWGSAFLYTEKQLVNGTHNAFEYYLNSPME